MDWKINIEDVEEEHQAWSWEEGHYERDRKHISVALGNVEASSHPFDVELTRLTPGGIPCPVHAHSNRWELFIIVSGKAVVQRNGKETVAIEGDCFIQPPDTRHRIRNASQTEELAYYVIADEPAVDSVERFEI